MKSLEKIFSLMIQPLQLMAEKALILKFPMEASRKNKEHDI